MAERVNLFEGIPEGSTVDDFDLQAAARFVKEVARACGDMELLGLAVDKEMTAAASIDLSMRQDEEYRRVQIEDYERGEEVAKLCRFHFFKEPKFTLDLTRYRALVEEVRASLSQEALYAIYKYLDERRVLRKVYCEVRDELRYGRKGSGLPELDEISEAFERAVQDFYDRADKYLPTLIKRGQNHNAVP